MNDKFDELTQSLDALTKSLDALTKSLLEQVTLFRNESAKPTQGSEALFVVTHASQIADLDNKIKNLSNQISYTFSSDKISELDRTHLSGLNKQLEEARPQLTKWLSELPLLEKNASILEGYQQQLESTPLQVASTASKFTKS